MSVISKVLGFARSTLLVVGAGIFGWFANQYMTDRAAFKSALNENYTSFNAVTDDVNASLKVFADVAQGKRAKTDEDVAMLQLRLLKAVGTAEDLGRRIKEPDAISSYKRAATKLKIATNTATGPLDSKEMVKAAEDYVFAEVELRNKVISQHNSLLF